MTEPRSDDEIDLDAAKVALIADRQAVEQFMLRTAGLVPQRCEAGRHADWSMRAIGRYRRISCPWCELDAERAKVAAVEARLRDVMAVKQPMTADEVRGLASLLLAALVGGSTEGDSEA